MKIFIELISFSLIFYTIIFYIRYTMFVYKIKKENNSVKTETKESKNIIIAIPCLREQRYIEDTVKYFTKVTKDIPIIIITTQKEIRENIKGDITTQEIVKNKILPKYKNVYWVDYPHTDGYMAHQLNYMIENIKEIFHQDINLNDTYLALYNADSRPNENTFKEIRMRIEENNKVIQQYSYCMQNYDKLGNILKGFSIYQSNFEIKTGLINTYLKSDFLYTHIVGHGLIISLELLNKMGNFNTDFWCEDIYLGLQLKFNNVKITPLLTLENMETPNMLKSLIKQNSVWFKTTSEFRKIYKDILKHGQTVNKYKGLIGVFNEFRCALNWIGFPIIILIGIIGGIMIKTYDIMLLLLISYLLYILINTIVTIKIINKLDNKKYKVNIITIFNVAIATAISNIGPIYSIINNKKEKYKTER